MSEKLDKMRADLAKAKERSQCSSEPHSSGSGGGNV